MDYEAKEKKLYKGFIFECIILTAIPVGFYLFFKFLFAYFNIGSELINELSARTLGFGLGSVVHMIFFIGGVFRDAIASVKRRIHNFFDLLSISLKIALKGYVDDLKNESVELWVYVFIMAVCAVIWINAFIQYANIRGLFC